MKVIVLSMFLNFLLLGNTDWNTKIYEKAGVIKIKDPLAYLTGTLKDDGEFTITLDDVGKYTGHICVGAASGFLMTQKALKILYPDSIPIRGDIKVTGSQPDDLFDIASYITGARNFYGRDEINEMDLVVDETLSKNPQEIVLIFTRKDNGKSVKATFFKQKLTKNSIKEAREISLIKKKVLSKKGTSEDLKKVQQFIQSKVESILNGIEKDLYKFEELN